MSYGWSTKLAGFAPAGLVAACLATPPSTDGTPGPALAPRAETAPSATDAAPAIDWSRGDCVSLLRVLQQAAREGRLEPDDQPPFAVELVPAAGSWLDAVPELPIETDLPLALDAAGARCVIRIGPPHDQTAAHRAIDVEDVRSAYQSGLRRERNPDYDLAQLKHREAKEDAKGRLRVVTVDDPLLDLIGTTVGGMIGALDDRVEQHAVDATAAELARTPRSVDRPVYRTYSFERVVVRAQKQAVVPVALLDGSGRQLRASDLRQRERREFFVLRGLDPRDRDYEQHRSTSMTRAELARWSRTPPVLRLSSVVAALSEEAAATRFAGIEPAGRPAMPESDEQPTTGDRTPEDSPATAGSALDDDGWPNDAPLAEDLLADPGFDLTGLAPAAGPERARAPAASPATAAEPHAPSIVAIRAGPNVGSGFYVREDLVLTAYQLVAAVSVVDVTAADGALVPALVAEVDPARGLALLHVPRPGPPVALYEGGALAAGRVVAAAERPGLPLFSNDQVIGMTTGGGAVVPADAMRAFLDSQAAELAAVP